MKHPCVMISDGEIAGFAIMTEEPSKALRIFLTFLHNETKVDGKTLIGGGGTVQVAAGIAGSFA